jgi:hypothetical protein
MHSPWLQQLLEQPRVFCTWFKFLRYPDDVFRSLCFMFELILYAKMDLVLHPEYMEVFVSPDAHYSYLLRVKREILLPADKALLDQLERDRRSVFGKVVIVPSGRKYIYSQFKLGALEIDRMRLLTILSSHLLSCLPVIPTLQLLARVARSLCLDSLYAQLYSDELYAKLMNKKPPPSLRCRECGKLDAQALPGQSWEMRWARIYGFAAELRELRGARNDPVPPAYQLHRCKQDIINAIEAPGAEPLEPALRAVVDRLLLGFEPVPLPAAAPPRGPPPTEFKVVFQRNDKDSGYGGKDPHHRTMQGSRQPSPGAEVWSSAPLSIYPAGHYGGQFKVVLDPVSRTWQHSYAVFDAMTRDEKRVGGFFIPLAAALWSMIEEGDLELLTRGLQHWFPRKRDPAPVPARCLLRQNWDGVCRVLESVFRTAESHPDDVFRWAALFVGNFIDPRPCYYGQRAADDDFWTAALAAADADTLARLTRRPFSEPRLPEVLPEIKEFALDPKAPREPMPCFVSPSGALALGYRKRRYADLEIHPIVRLFYIVECKRRGMTDLQIGAAPMHPLKRAPRLDACWVMAPGAPAPVADLTVVAADWEMECIMPPRPPQPVPDLCPRNHRKVSRGAASEAAALPPPPPAAHEEARRAAREERQRAAIEADADGSDARKVQAQMELFHLATLLRENGVHGTDYCDGNLQDAAGNTYEIKGKQFIVTKAGTGEQLAFENSPRGAAEWARA